MKGTGFNGDRSELGMHRNVPLQTHEIIVIVMKHVDAVHVHGSRFMVMNSQIDAFQ